jgi:hypothetical protein
MRALAGKNTQMYDAKQMAIVPGFIDCHNHAPGTTLLYEVLVGNPYEVEFVSISGFLQSVVEEVVLKKNEISRHPGHHAPAAPMAMYPTWRF